MPGRDVRWIERTEALEQVLARLGPGPLALDTEADSFHHYREKVCLVQLSAGDLDLLVDPLAGLDPAPLAPLLADPARRKILHGADYDVRMLHRDFGMEIRGLFDTMIAARLCGERAFGLAALLARHFGVELDKRFQRADWSKRPLSSPMKDYALADTRHLEPLAEILGEELERLGRTEWAGEEFERVAGVRWAGERSSDEMLQRLKGVGTLDRRGLAAAHELLVLRDRTARRRDLPAFRILRDDVLLELAHSSPKWPDDLRGVAGLGRAWLYGPGRRELLDALERGRSVPRERLPLPPARPARRSNPEMEKRIKQLCRERDRVGQELGLEPSLLASRATLEKVLRHLDDGGAIDAAPGLSGWQASLLAPMFQGAGG